MNDNELKDMFFFFLFSILNLQSEFTETRSSLQSELAETRSSLQSELAETKSSLQSELAQTRDSLHNEIVEVKDSLSEEISEVQQSVRKLELTLENEINKKIDALFDGRIDEIRHRKENIETNAKVADLEMRVDNLEKIIKAS